MQLGFADLEFLRQGVVLERELRAIIDFLDEHERMTSFCGGFAPQKLVIRSLAAC